MAAQPQSTEPPKYDDANETAITDLIQPPTTLYVAGRFIHSSDPQAPPLYEFSHSIGFLRDTDRSVRVERLDYTVKDHNGTPQVNTRKRHIYNLKHPTLGEWSTFTYLAETVSREALCAFALETFRAKRFTTTRSYRVVRTTRGPAPQRLLIGREVLFSASPPSQKEQATVMYEWADAQGRLVAREVQEHQLLRLVISAEMGAKLRDALVTAWITRVWWELARGNHRGNIWDDGEFMIWAWTRVRRRLMKARSETNIEEQQRGACGIQTLGDLPIV